MTDEDSNAAAQEPRVTVLERIATGISALLVCGIIAVLMVDAIHPHARPTFRASVDRVERTTSTIRAAVKVENLGDDAAKSVSVHVELLLPAKDSAKDEGDIVIDWLPGKASRTITALFDESSAEPFRMRASVRGYVVP
jgi:uncharacterized protein (TIGR02588 family)